MDKLKSSKYVHVYNANTQGRDFVVGDIHGCYDEFMMALKKIGFNFEKDRIFSVGDIIDRGTNNVKSMTLIDEPWFFLILGNHEAMLKEKYFYNAERNGTLWAKEIYEDVNNENHKQLIMFINKLKNLPYVFYIKGKGNKEYVVTHAELPFKFYHEEDITLDELKKDENKDYFSSLDFRECNVLWGRSQHMWNDVIYGVDWVFHGHTIFDTPHIAGNRCHIDLGFCLGNLLNKKTGLNADGKLCLVELGEDSEIIHIVTVSFGKDPGVVGYKKYFLTENDYTRNNQIKSFF